MQVTDVYKHIDLSFKKIKYNTEDVFEEVKLHCAEKELRASDIGSICDSFLKKGYSKSENYKKSSDKSKDELFSLVKQGEKLLLDTTNHGNVKSNVFLSTYVSKYGLLDNEEVELHHRNTNLTGYVDFATKEKIIDLKCYRGEPELKDFIQVMVYYLMIRFFDVTNTNTQMDKDMLLPYTYNPFAYEVSVHRINEIEDYKFLFECWKDTIKELVLINPILGKRYTVKVDSIKKELEELLVKLGAMGFMLDITHRTVKVCSMYEVEE